MKIEKLNVPFAQIPNELLSDPTVSLKAKGLWAYIQSKPSDYDFSSDRIIEENADKVDSVKTGLIELEEKGYLLRLRKQSGRVDYKLLFPKVENPSKGKSLKGKIHRISNNNYTNNNIDNTSITYAVEKPLVEINKQVEVITPKGESQDFFKILQERGEKFNDVVSFISKNKSIAPAFVAEELMKFLNYWTEKNHSGKKQRWQMEKTFEPKRRLVTWFNNKEGWAIGREIKNKYKVKI